MLFQPGLFNAQFLVFCCLVALWQWEQKVEKGEEDFGKISKMIQKEMARFEVRNIACDLAHEKRFLAFADQRQYLGNCAPTPPLTQQIIIRLIL